MAIEFICLETTNRCNYACVHCLRADIAPRKDLPLELQNAIGPVNPRHDISLEIIEKIIDEARPFNIPRVSFTGGEPTIHPQFKEIVRKFCEAGYQFGMVTNGTEFVRTYEAIKPFQNQLYMIFFSMDGATEAIMDSIRAKNSFRKALQAISICKAKNIPFTIQMVITATNHHEIEDFAILGSKLGAKNVCYTPIQTTLQTTYKKMNLPPAAWYEIKQKIAALKKLYNVSIYPYFGFPVDDSSNTKCDALMMRALYIDYLGNLTFCCALSEYADSQVRNDIIENLANVSLFDAYNKYVEMITAYQKEKLRRYKNHELTKLDAFPCWYCAKYFNKVHWMKRFPDDPWAKDIKFANLAQYNESNIPLNDHINTNFVSIQSVTSSS